jgi:hypothetical protein
LDPNIPDVALRETVFASVAQEDLAAAVDQVDHLGSASSRATDFVNPMTPNLGGIAGCDTGNACDVYYGPALHVRYSILDSQEGAPKQKGDGSVKSVDGNFGYRSAYTPRSRVIHDAIEPAEAFYREIHKRFGVRLTCRVCPVKRHVFAEFLFESFSFFVQEITKDNSSAFLNETPDNACSDSSGAAGNDSNLIVKP